MPGNLEIWVRRDNRKVKVYLHRVCRCPSTNTTLVEYFYGNGARVMRSYWNFIEEWEPEPRTSWERIMAED